MRLYSLFALSAVSVALSGTYASAASIYTNSPGAVASADRIANFDGILSGSSIGSYEENGIGIQSNSGPAYVDFSPAPAGFSGGFYYAAHADSDYFVINATGGARFAGIQFHVGSGFLLPSMTEFLVTYELLRGAATVASGIATVSNSEGLATLGFRDEDGIDSIRLASYNPAAGNFQSTGNGLAMDNLTMEMYTPLSSVPEPATLALIGSSIAVILSLQRCCKL